MNDSRRIEDLHSYFQPIVREVLDRAPREGLYPFIMSGKRNPEYQACLHARGRSRPGEVHRIGGYNVTVRQEGPSIVAVCGSASYTVPKRGWSSIVTKVLWSWHVLGFAIDLGFRSGPDRLDHWVGDLERERKWTKIEELYARMHALVADAAPDIRWGNDWNQNGIPVPRDPAESFSDMPHWEWHPGRSIEEVRNGKLPPYPQQCQACRRFPAVLVDNHCRDCEELVVKARRASMRPADRECVGAGRAG